MNSQIQWYKVWFLCTTVISGEEGIKTERYCGWRFKIGSVLFLFLLKHFLHSRLESLSDSLPSLRQQLKSIGSQEIPLSISSSGRRWDSSRLLDLYHKKISGLEEKSHILPRKSVTRVGIKYEENFSAEVE